MPRFDGTGPRGDGPMTGRGEGYCVLELPEPGRPIRGYAGLEGTPVNLETPSAWPGWWPRTAVGSQCVRGRGLGRGACRGRGHWSPRR
jgi:hypothetical protein